MAQVWGGPRTYKLSRDESMYRTYSVQHLVKADVGEGPGAALLATGLPQPGDVWNFGDDYDPWCWCRADADVKIHQEREGDPAEWYVVEQKFSNAPRDPESSSRCSDTAVEDPLLEPVKVSGGFAKSKIEATEDRFGESILTSSHELIRGPQNEWDKSLPNVSMEQNVPDLELGLLAAMIDTVNAYPLWGLPARTIKLSNITWSKQYYGSCYVYYTRKFEFEINFDGWDKDILDEGTKVLRGHWKDTEDKWVLDPVWFDGVEIVLPNPANPNHFDRYKDRNGENCRVILDGAGQPFVPHIETTDECEGCLDGMPKELKVKGFVDEDGNPVSDTLVNEPGGETCTWSGSEGVLKFGVDPDAAGFGAHWYYKNSNHPDETWRRTDEETWNCGGKNYMPRTYTGEEQTGPDTIYLKPVAPEPGKIHVEKYAGSDFLLLGIPTTF